jgi:hypothetical protein
MPHICHIKPLHMKITNAVSLKEMVNADQKTPKLGNG